MIAIPPGSMGTKAPKSHPPLTGPADDADILREYQELGLAIDAWDRSPEEGQRLRSRVRGLPTIRQPLGDRPAALKLARDKVLANRDPKAFAKLAELDTAVAGLLYGEPSLAGAWNRGDEIPRWPHEVFPQLPDEARELFLRTCGHAPPTESIRRFVEAMANAIARPVWLAATEAWARLAIHDVPLRESAQSKIHRHLRRSASDDGSGAPATSRSAPATASSVHDERHTFVLACELARFGIPAPGFSAEELLAFAPRSVDADTTSAFFAGYVALARGTATRAPVLRALATKLDEARTPYHTGQLHEALRALHGLVKDGSAEAEPALALEQVLSQPSFGERSVEEAWCVMHTARWAKTEGHGRILDHLALAHDGRWRTVTLLATGEDVASLERAIGSELRAFLLSRLALLDEITWETSPRHARTQSLAELMVAIDALQRMARGSARDSLARELLETDWPLLLRRAGVSETREASLRGTVGAAAQAELVLFATRHKSKVNDILRELDPPWDVLLALVESGRPELRRLLATKVHDVFRGARHAPTDTPLWLAWRLLESDPDGRICDELAELAARSEDPELVSLFEALRAVQTIRVPTSTRVGEGLPSVHRALDRVGDAARAIAVRGASWGPFGDRSARAAGERTSAEFGAFDCLRTSCEAIEDAVSRSSTSLSSWRGLFRALFTDPSGQSDQNKTATDETAGVPTGDPSLLPWLAARGVSAGQLERVTRSANALVEALDSPDASPSETVGPMRRRQALEIAASTSRALGDSLSFSSWPERAMVDRAREALEQVLVGLRRRAEEAARAEEELVALQAAHDWMPLRALVEGHLAGGVVDGLRDVRQSVFRPAVDACLKAAAEAGDEAWLVRLARAICESVPDEADGADPRRQSAETHLPTLHRLLLLRLEVGRARALRRTARTKGISLPSEVRHFAPLLLCVMASPFISIETATEWNDLATHVSRPSYVGTILVALVLSFALLASDLGRHFGPMGDPRRTGAQRRRSVVVAARAAPLFAALYGLLCLEMWALRTMWRDTAFVLTSSSTAAPTAPAVFVWAAVSLFMGVFLELVVEGRRATSDGESG